MKRYRSNVRSDPARLEKMRKKDRERKKAKRDQHRQAVQSGNRKLEKKIKTQRNTYMKRYRDKKKTKTNDQLDDSFLKDRQEK